MEWLAIMTLHLNDVFNVHRTCKNAERLLKGTIILIYFILIRFFKKIIIQYKAFNNISLNLKYNKMKFREIEHLMEI